MPRKPGTPSLRRHKRLKQGVVTLNGKDIWLGVWRDDQEEPPAAVRTRYHQEIAEWEARGRLPALVKANTTKEDDAGVTVAELILAFMRHAEGYYRQPDGKPTNEVSEFVMSLRPLNHLYGATAAREVGPLKLKAVRELMVKGYEHPTYGEQPALCRGVVNARIRRIARCYRWASGEELVGIDVYLALKNVKGLAKNRTAARESEPVLPVAIEDVDATLPHLSPMLNGIVRLQLHTGARPGEARIIRLGDIDRGESREVSAATKEPLPAQVWLYRPASHKTAYRGKNRVVAIGPKGQAVLREFIKIRCPLCGLMGRPPRIGSPDGCICGPCADRMTEVGICGPWQRIEAQPADAYLFSPTEAATERNLDRRAKRKTKVQPSQVCRKKPKAQKQPGRVYTKNLYAKHLKDACQAAGVQEWQANQLRHTRATEIRKRYGLEAAQVALGHATADVTQVYAERDLTLAVKVASEIG
jgi:integrase